MSRPRAGRGPDGGDSKFLIDVVVVRIVVVRIDYNPAPVPGPVVSRRSALEAPALRARRPRVPRAEPGSLVERRGRRDVLAADGPSLDR